MINKLRIKEDPKEVITEEKTEDPTTTALMSIGTMLSRTLQEELVFAPEETGKGAFAVRLFGLLLRLLVLRLVPSWAPQGPGLEWPGRQNLEWVAHL